MKHLMSAAVTALILTTGIAQATPCDTLDLNLRWALEDSMLGASDPRVASMAQYLNDDFFTDLTCRMSHGKSPAEIARLAQDPAALTAAANMLTAGRNQSDALMLILSAMQTTIDRK